MVLAEEYLFDPHGEALGICRRRDRAGAPPRRPRGSGERCPAARLVAEFEVDGPAVTQETLLWDGEQQRVAFSTDVDGLAGRVAAANRFPPTCRAGAQFYQTATAVIGRLFGHPGIDAAEHWGSDSTLDNPAHDWGFGDGFDRPVALTGPDGTRLTEAIGVAEVINPGVGRAQPGSGP